MFLPGRMCHGNSNKVKTMLWVCSELYNVDCVSLMLIYKFNIN